MTSDESQRREHILAAAERLLNHYGPSKTTIADIAREAGVGVGTVYLEFASKEAIVEELSNGQHRAVLAEMRRAASAPGASYAERLRRVLDARVHALIGLCEGGAHARDLIHCVSPAVKAAEARFREGEQKLLADLLREATRAGEFDVPKPEHMARVVLLAYVSFSPPWIFNRPRSEVQRMLRAMHDLVLSGLATR